MIRVSMKELADGRKGNTKSKMNELFDTYVPDSGKCDKVIGEIVRAWKWLMYRLLNDGDTPFTGYGVESCGPEMNYLINTVKDIKFPKYSSDDGEDKLIDYGTRLLKYFELNPELKNEKNTIDSSERKYKN